MFLNNSRVIVVILWDLLFTRLNGATGNIQQDENMRRILLL